MANINDLIYNALVAMGYSGPIDSMRLARFLDEGAKSTNINEAQREWLILKGAPPRLPINEMWAYVLRKNGYSGHISEMYYDFWAQGGTFGAAPSAFTVGMWSVGDKGTDGEVDVTINSLPDKGTEDITNIEYSLNGGFWIPSGGTSSFTISGINNGQEYTVNIRAVSSVGAGPTSDTKTVTPTSVPEAFGDSDWSVSDANTDGTLSVTINSLPFDNGRTITDIEYRLDSGSWVSSGGTVSFDITSLVNDQEYTVYIRAVNALGEAVASSGKVGTPTKLTGIPDAFAGEEWAVSDMGDGTGLFVTINSLPNDNGATITDVEYSLDDGSWVSSGGTSSFLISSLDDGTEYSVRIRAVNSVGPGSASSAKTATSTNVPEEFTTGMWTVTDKGTGGAVEVTINLLPFNGGKTITDIEYSVDSGSWTSSEGTSSFQIGGLDNGTEYDIRIRAVNSNGDGPASTVKSVTPTGLPSAFISGDWSVNDKGTDGAITVTINTLPDNGGKTITDVEYRIGSGGSWVSSGGTSSFDITGLTNGSQVSVYIRAVNVNGEGPASGSKSVTPTSVPEAFTSGDWSLSDKTTGGTLEVTINSLPNGNGKTVTGVDYRLDGGSWVSSGGVVSFDITGLTDDQEYSVELRAVNANGAGPAGDTKSATPTNAAGFVVDNQVFEFGANTRAGAGEVSFTASTGTIASIGTPSGSNVADLDISFDSGSVYVSPSGNGLANGPYIITVPCYSGAGQTGTQDDVTLTIPVNANEWSVATTAELQTAVAHASLDYGHTIACRAGVYDTPTLNRANSFSTGYVRPSSYTAVHQGRDYSTGNPVKITSYGVRDAVLRNVTINNSGNMEGFLFENLKIDRPADGSSSSNLFALYMAATCDDVYFHDCLIEGDPDFTVSLDADMYAGMWINGQYAAVQDCDLTGLSYGLKISAADNQQVIGNEITLNWIQPIKFAGLGNNTRVNWNIVHQKDSLDFSPPNQVHGDMVQITAVNGNVNVVEFIGNMMWMGLVSTGYYSGQGLFESNWISGTISGLIIVGNFLDLDLAYGINFNGPQDGAIYRSNTIVNDMSNLRNETKIIQASMTNGVCRDNVAHAIDLGGDSSVDLGNNDTGLDHTDDSTYTARFNAPAGGASLTDPETQFSPKAAGPLDVEDYQPIIGAFPPAGRTGYFNYAARTMDLPWQETGYSPSFTDLTNQNTSDPVSLEFQVTGVSATGAEVYFTGGNSASLEIRGSDNTTVVVTGVSPGEHVIVYDGQYVEISDTTSVSENTATNITVHIGAESDVWTHTTGTAGDVTAPTLSSPVGTANGATGANGSVSTDEGNGVLYWVVTQSSTSPSAAQVKAGNDHTGSAADDSGSQSVSGTGVQNLSPAPSGLTAETTYYLHFMHEDAATNQSSVSTSSSFTTEEASGYVDTFVRGAYGTLHESATSDGKSSWTVEYGNVRTVSPGAAENTNLDEDSGGVLDDAPASADIVVSVTVTTGGPYGGFNVFARRNPAGNSLYYGGIYYDDNTSAYRMYLSKEVSGIETSLGEISIGASIAAGTVFSLTCNASNISMTWTGGAQEVSVTDSSVQDAGAVGFYIYQFDAPRLQFTKFEVVEL